MSGFAKGSEEALAWALAQAKDDSQRLLDDWRNVDAKAQGATAIAGILIGAAMVYVKSALTLTEAEKTLVVIVVGCLVATIWFAIRSMRLRTIESLLTASDMHRAIKEMNLELDPRRDVAGKVLRLQLRTLAQFDKANASAYLMIKDKAFELKRAHTVLGLSGALIVGLLLLTLWGR